MVLLRLQKERMTAALLPSEREFFNLYGMTESRLQLAKDNAIVMHPGPINRGVEIANEVADGQQAVILDQVTNGIAIRMAVMAMTLSTQQDDHHECHYSQHKRLFHPEALCTGRPISGLRRACLLIHRPYPEEKKSTVKLLAHP